MNEYFADLHIHIGRTKTGKPVKITASRQLTMYNILRAAKYPKGLDIVGVVDCHSPEVICEIEQYLEEGIISELEGGGFRYENEVTLIPGCEIEIYDSRSKGPFHVLVYLPDLRRLKEFSEWLGERVTNLQLSTQRIYEEGVVLQEKVKSLGGLFIPAHIFTPFKSLYGKGVTASMNEILNPEWIDGVELGLSSNTEMADSISELHKYTFTTNSDAHSLQKIAREYQKLELNEPTFQELKKVFMPMEKQCVKENYGLNPFLGKYYRTTCAECQTPMGEELICPNCDSRKTTLGVSERIAQLADAEQRPNRPPYIHQVPLEFIPGLGPKTLEKLLDHFGTEMDILHRVNEMDLEKLVKPQLADLIIKARTGKLEIHPGGGGKYGRVNPR